MTTHTRPFRRSLFFFLAAMLAVQGCSKDRSVQTDDPGVPAARSVQEEREPPPPTPFERIQAAPNLRAAFAIAKPEMVDPRDDEGKGTLLFLAWAARSMVWSDVGVAQDESSYALVMKDADEERGKRMCVPGNLIQISVEKADAGKVHIGREARGDVRPPREPHGQRQPVTDRRYAGGAASVVCAARWQTGTAPIFSA